jgi:hypothetical protein
MRLITTLLLCCLCGAALAGEQPPANLQPLPPPPPLNANATDTNSADEELEPQVTITKKGDMTIEEYRSGGKLYMIKITPKVGKPYYMVDENGDGKFARQESLDSGLRPPRWIIHRF